MASENELTWTAQAQNRLKQVPEGMMRDLTRRRVEALARRRRVSTVDKDLIEDKYGQWEEGSAQAFSELTWTEEAERRVQRIPPFVRGMVVQAVEEFARQKGDMEITLELMDEAKGSWEEGGIFHNSGKDGQG